MDKNGHFCDFFFLSKIGQENVFYDILERIKAFLGYENKKLKRRKIDIFPKGLTHGFGLKMAIFRTFFFGQNRPEKSLFYDILEQIKAFLRYENKKLKQLKKLTFFQRG